MTPRGCGCRQLAPTIICCLTPAAPARYWAVNGPGLGGDSFTLTHRDVVENDVRTVFSLVFGSWFGDWDHGNNLLRAFLATPTYGLVAAWSGRPHWFLHPLGLGETIGACARLTQNNTGLYENQVNSEAGEIHIALMGDPTLRLHPVVPVSNLTGIVADEAVALTWSASTDEAIIGYHIYRAVSSDAPFTRLTETPVSGTSYTVPSATAGATYMVRAIKLEQSPSGSYYNASQGVFWSSAPAAPPPAVAPPVNQSQTSASATRLGNISVRSHVGLGDNVLIAGFIIRGDEPKQVLIRAAGPALNGQGLTGTLAQTRVQLFQGSEALLANAGWSTATNAASIAQLGSAFGAFTFAPGSGDSAILTTLAPGAYTAIVSGADGGTGVALVEIYETSASLSRLSNLSGRSWVGTDNDVLIAGLIVGGAGPKQILLRALGPVLATLGVPGALADPQLQVFAGSNLIAQNDDWGGGVQVVNASAQVGAFPLPATSKDAVLLVTLAPGGYTVIVSGVNRATGVAMIEAYELP